MQHSKITRNIVIVVLLLSSFLMIGLITYNRVLMMTSTWTTTVGNGCNTFTYTVTGNPSNPPPVVVPQYCTASSRTIVSAWTVTNCAGSLTTITGPTPPIFNCPCIGVGGGPCTATTPTATPVNPAVQRTLSFILAIVGIYLIFRREK
ncbi:MAG: hypothetical protein ACLPY5_09300 [Candidatus Bathyarchaeia archaeon]